MPAKTGFGTSEARPAMIAQPIGLRQRDNYSLHANGSAYNCVLKALTILRLLRNSRFVPGRLEVCCTGQPRNCTSGCARKRDPHETAWQMASKIMATQARGRSCQRSEFRCCG